MLPIRLLTVLTLMATSVALFAAEPGAVRSNAQEPVVGSWKLLTVDGKQPPGFLRGSVLVITKARQIMAVRAADAALNKNVLSQLISKATEKGYWEIKSGRLFASNSTFKEGAAFEVKSGRLHFANDPYISDNDVASRTVYERIPE